MVEQAAISAVTEYYTKVGYQVDSVERDNVGWDLTAVRDNRELKLEVKGLSGSDLVIELTPNEYKKMREHRDTYCVCIVSAALTKSKLEIFSYVAGSDQWESTDRRVLNLQELVGARCRAM